MSFEILQEAKELDESIYVGISQSFHAKSKFPLHQRTLCMVSGNHVGNHEKVLGIV